MPVARQKMEALGFTCTLRKGDFGDQITAKGATGDYVCYSDVNYLACAKEGNIHLVRSRLWVVALVYDQSGVVTNVLVQIWKMGLSNL